MSRAIFEAPTIRPVASRTGEIVTENVDLGARPCIAAPSRSGQPARPANTVQNHVLFVQSLGRKEKGYGGRSSSSAR